MSYDKYNTILIPIGNVLLQLLRVGGIMNRLIFDFRDGCCRNVFALDFLQLINYINKRFMFNESRTNRVQIYKSKYF